MVVVLNYSYLSETSFQVLPVICLRWNTFDDLHVKMGGLAVSFKIGKCRGNSKFSKVLLFSLFGFVFAFYRNVQLAYQFKLLEWDIDDNLSSYY